VGAHADLAVGMTATPNPVVFGSNLTYQISVTNKGPDQATNVMVTDALPAGLNWVSTAASQGTFSFSAGVVTCALGTLPAGGITTISIQTVPATNEKITNLVTVTSPVADLVGANNLASNVVTVVELGAFSTILPIQILDAGPSDPYPSIITVSNLVGTLSKVTVTLSDLTHTYPADLDILLVGPQGQNVLLMSDVGAGFDLNAVKLQFDDAAAAYLPTNSQIVAGSYKPTNFGEGDSFNPPAPLGPFGMALSVFNGTDPNGNWSLYIMDDQGLDTGTLATGWRLGLTSGVVQLLRIDFSGGQWVLSWPGALIGYVLESRNTLSPSDTWATVSGTPSLVGGRWSLNLSSTGNGQFFRLRQ
jgi:uncharacterized repeat protein (TIGR01451 family)